MGRMYRRLEEKDQFVSIKRKKSEIVSRAGYWKKTDSGMVVVVRYESGSVFNPALLCNI